MRLSIVVSVQPASFSALAFQERLPENLATVKKLGYDGVELAVRDPRRIDTGDLQSLLGETGLPVSAIGTGQAYGEEGLSLTHPDSAIRAQAIARLRDHVHLAACLKAVVIIGLIRGKRETDITEAQAEAWLRHALEECAQEDPSVDLAIEPINRYETNLLNSVEAALRFLDRLEVNNVGLLLDTFHMNIEEPSLLASIESARARLLHFHVADSNRWHPGAGHIDFGAIMARLEQLDYRGFVSAEILPLPDPDTAAAMTIREMRRYQGRRVTEPPGSTGNEAVIS